jgi:hypothetical protein
LFLRSKKKRGKLKNFLTASFSAVGLVVLLFYYLPIWQGLEIGINLLHSISALFFSGLILFLAVLFFGILQIRRKRNFLNWFTVLFLLLFSGCMVGILGFLFALEKGDSNGCITEDCAWFD